MASVEDPAYWTDKGICSFVSGRVSIEHEMKSIGGANILDNIICPNYSRKDGRCKDSSCTTESGRCAYLEYPFLGSIGLPLINIDTIANSQ